MFPYDFSRFGRILDSLTEPGRQGSGGYTRLAFSPEERESHLRLHALFKDPRFVVWTDAVGNSFIMLPGSDTSLPALLIGSHLDTVPNGGKIDGAMGVAVGAEILLAILQSGITPKRSIILIAFVGEESSRFSTGCLGSRWFTGCLDVEQFLQRRDSTSGRLASEVLREAGINLRDLRQGNSFRGPFHAYVEAHNSQGPTIECGKGHIGIVRAIAAPERLEVRIDGTAAHSGTCPMRMRRDALVAAATVVLEVEAAAVAEGEDASVATVGNLEVPGGSMNVVPGETTLFIDIRDVDVVRRERVKQRIFAAFEKLKQRGFLVTAQQIQRGDPVMLSAELVETVVEVATALNVPFTLMDSGAGHDAMFLSPSAMVFVATKDGISHNKAEFSDPVDIEAGLKVMTGLAHRLAL